MRGRMFRRGKCGSHLQAAKASLERTFWLLDEAGAKAVAEPATRARRAAAVFIMVAWALLLRKLWAGITTRANARRLRRRGGEFFPHPRSQPSPSATHQPHRAYNTAEKAFAPALTQ